MVTHSPKSLACQEKATTLAVPTLQCNSLWVLQLDDFVKGSIHIIQCEEVKVFRVMSGLLQKNTHKNIALLKCAIFFMLHGNICARKLISIVTQSIPLPNCSLAFKYEVYITSVTICDQWILTTEAWVSSKLFYSHTNEHLLSSMQKNKIKQPFLIKCNRFFFYYVSLHPRTHTHTITHTWLTW